MARTLVTVEPVVERREGGSVLVIPTNAIPAARSTAQRTASALSESLSQIAHVRATGSVNAASPTLLIAVHMNSVRSKESAAV